MTARDSTPRVNVGFALAKFLGMTVEQAGSGRAVASLEAADSHVNPHGTVHGAVLFALVDTAMGAATYDVLGPGQSCASIEVQLRFLRPVPPSGTIRAEIRVVHAGRRVVQLEGRVTHADRAVAMASGSFALFDVADSEQR